MTKVNGAFLTLCFGVLVLGCGGSSSSGSSSSVAKKLMACSAQSSSASVTCTGTDQYNTCIEGKCSSQFKKCFGDNYQSGQAGGVCGTYLDCVNKAADPCHSGCTPSSDCQACETTDIVSCEMTAGCTLPMCTVTTGASGAGSAGKSGGSGGSSAGSAGAAAAGTCKDLTACCAKISDANAKSACQSLASMGNEQICSATLPSVKSLCP